jgi:fatty-acyl-CoA synthase
MILDISKFSADSYRDAIAFEDYNGGKYSYREVDAIANSFANELSELGVKKGSVISLFSDNTALEAVLLFAAIKLRATLAVHNIKLKDPEIIHEIETVKPSIAIVNEGLPQSIQNLVRDTGISSLNLKSLKINNADHPPGVQQDLEDNVLIIFTGGTTGEPKGAKIPLRSIIFNAVNTSLSWKLTLKDVSLLAYPFYHTGGWNVLTLPIFIVGGKTVIIQKFRPELIASILNSGSITVFSTVPAVLLEITQLSDFNSMNFSSLRFIKSGGGMSSPGVVESFRSKGVKIFQGYGLTEAGPNIFYSSDEDLKRPMSLGRKTPFCDLRLVDENGSESTEGELQVGGPIVFSGYVGMENSLTGGDTYVKTGDILRMDENGFYYFVGRKKFMYKSGGENIYPTEIESVLEMNPSVTECAVIGIPDEKWGEVGKAYVVLRKEMTEEELRKFAERYIAKYKIPKYFEFVRQIPKTSAGKKDYASLIRGGKDE